MQGCRKSRPCPAPGTWRTKAAPALKISKWAANEKGGRGFIYLFVYLFISLALKPHPELTKEKFSLTSAARISSCKGKHHGSPSVSSTISNQKTFMTSNTLYIEHCYEGFNICITQIPLCLNVFKGAISSTFSQPWCWLWLGRACSSSQTPTSPKIIHLPPSKLHQKKVHLPQIAPGGSFPCSLFFEKKLEK